MEIVLLTFGSIALGLFVNILLKQIYNFIFMLAKSPVTWILISIIISFSTWYISAMMKWNVNIPIFASIIAILMNMPPSYNDDASRKMANQFADEMYLEMGIKNGRLLYRVGLVCFSVSCVISWVLFYGIIL